MIVEKQQQYVRMLLAAFVDLGNFNDKKGLWDALRIQVVRGHLNEGIRSFNTKLPVFVNVELSVCYDIGLSVRYVCVIPSDFDCSVFVRSTVEEKYKAEYRIWMTS